MRQPLAAVQRRSCSGGPRIETIIEFTHRAMSGAALVGVVALWLWSRTTFSRGTGARKMALASLVFLITEASLGAGLVLFNYVGQRRVGRTGVLSLAAFGQHAAAVGRASADGLVFAR